MSRFFVPQECIRGDIALITGREAHHILKVMRLKKGDHIEVFDGSGRRYKGKILDTYAKKLKLKIKSVQQQRQNSNLQLALGQALPKKNKMDYIVEKATELGVDVIIPLQTARTIVKLDKTKQLTRQKRWQMIAQEAAKQSGRTTVPDVKKLSTWPDVLSLNDFDLKLLPCLNEKAQQIKDILRAQNKTKRIILFIGPEGGFTPSEIEKAIDAGCTAVSLGANVLKSDTATVSALAMVNYELRQ